MTNSERIMLMPKWKGAMLAVTLLAVPASAQAQTVSAIATEPATGSTPSAAVRKRVAKPAPAAADGLAEDE